MASSVQPRFASRTAFNYLPVESGEESEEEVETPVEEEETKEETPAVKLTKTAQKKAAKAAKEARAKLRKPSPSPASTSAAVPDTPPTAPTPAPIDEPVAPVPASLAAEDLADVSTPPAPVPEPVPAVYEPVPVPEPAPAPAVVDTPKPAAPTPEPTPPVVSIPLQEVPVAKANGNHAPPTAKAPEPAPSPEAAEKHKKRQSIITRTATTLLMIAAFIALLLMGHVYMVMLVMLCQMVVYREITALFSLTNSTTAAETEDGEAEKSKDKDPWSKTLNWYFFVVTNYFLYGESIIYYFKHVIFTNSELMPFATNHRIISFCLYTIGFMGFVMSLKKNFLKQQFGLFCWVHMTLLMVVVSSHFIVNNILEGLIWFWVPASLVICNDIFAYIWGMTFGRTPLIALSPKKTVEGFVGAFFSTLLFGVLWGSYFMKFNYMICPVQELGVNAWSAMQCTPNPVFVWTEWPIWEPVAKTLSTALGTSITAIPYAPYHIHLLALSTFASLVAPFGGFFASGFKRAFNIKDFGDSIPGHGGMTDRMDCQFLMGVFTYVYYSSIIRQHNVTVGSILETIVSGLSTDEQLQVISDLSSYLTKQGVRVPC